jgi:hypothetical protein
MNIPKGYQLRINTWENDLDSCDTNTISCLTAEDVKFYLHIARHFTSCNNKKPGLGNTNIKLDKLAKIINDALLAHPDISLEHNELWKQEGEGEDDIECLFDILCDTLLGHQQYDGGYKPYFCRVFDSYEVYFFETEVEDVSSHFK